MKFSKLPSLALLFIVFYLTINISGYAQIYEGITAAESLDLINANIDNPNFVILDVRTPGEHNPQHLEGAINRDFYDSDFSDQLDQLDKNKKYLIHCKSGGRSGVTLGTMEALNFVEVYDMLGGMNAWNANALPTTNAFAPRIMFVSDNNFPLEVINIGDTETIPVTITNRANSTLTFSAVSSLAATEFSTDFDLETELLGSEDYTFNIFYTPTDETEDELTFSIENNDATAVVTIIRNGDNTVGLAETNAGLRVKIYPNPTANILQFEGLSSNETNIEILNASGQIILRKQLQGLDDFVDVSGLVSGTYFVKLVEEGLVFAKKMIVK